MARIRLLNLSGDEVLATYDPADSASVELAQRELTAFLEECIRSYKCEPPVWARRIGRADFELFGGALEEVEDVLLQYPLVGG